MFKRFTRKCLTSLLIMSVVGGAIGPPTVRASQTDQTKYSNIAGEQEKTAYGSLNYRKVKYPYYYGNNNKIGSVRRSEAKVFHMYMTGNKYETFGWASPHSNVVKQEMKDSLSLELRDIKNLGKLDTDKENNFSEVFLAKIDESLGTGIADREELMQSLSSLNESQGASTADLSNLNQRFAAFLYMRLNPSEFIKDNGYLWDTVEAVDDAQYSDMLTTTLSVGHEKRFRSLLTKIGIMQKENTISDTPVYNEGNVVHKDFAFSVPIAGLLALDTAQQQRDSGGGGGGATYTDSDAKIYNASNVVLIANEMALYICLSEYADWYLSEMPTVVQTTGWENNDEVKGILTFLKTFNDTFGKYIPVITQIYECKNADAGDLSIKDMVESAGVTDSTMQEALQVNTSTYSPHTDSASPITKFYSANSDIGIISYQRDTILADIEVDRTYDELSEDERRNEKHNEDTTGDDDMYEITNTFLTTQATLAKKLLDLLEKPADELDAIDKLGDENSDSHKEFNELFEGGQMNNLLEVLYDHYGEPWATSVESAVRDERWADFWMLFTDEHLRDLKSISSGDLSIIRKYLDKQTKKGKAALKELAEDSVDFGVDENGIASSLDSVIINKFIVEGMGYSTTYIPMRTNLYNADVLKMYKGDSAEDTDFYDFFKRYGFMRKALLKDTSASSAVDYYNAGGKLTNSLKVCTLRDMLYSGDKDLTLYIDSTFYNAQDAIDTGNKVLDETRLSRIDMEASFQEYAAVWKNSTSVLGKATEFAMGTTDKILKAISLGLIDNDTIKFDDMADEYRKTVKTRYKFDIGRFENAKDMIDYTNNLASANEVSAPMMLSMRTLKSDDTASYDTGVRAQIASCEDSDYVNLSSESNTDFLVKKDSDVLYTDDNPDTIVLTSAQINEYLSGITQYKDVSVNDEGTEKTTNTYTSDSGYSPMTSLAYVSCLYRDNKNFLLANAVENNNPVFMASDDLCGIKEANQWYRNTLLNYAMLKNLIANAQVDVSFVTDLDCPVYMDVFGNILTESGIVVIPAACNATLHPGSFKGYNYGVGLYAIYGKEYHIPSDTKGAMSVLYPYFVSDDNIDKFVISGVTMQANNVAVRFDKLDTYDDDTRKAVMNAYKASIATQGTTRLNWMAMVKIINEVMRGAPIENIDKEQESLYIDSSKTSLIAAAKLEALLESFQGQSSNTLLCIPDFSRMDNMEYWIALLIKLMAVVTTAVVIIAVYRDGVASNLGLRTIGKSVAAIALSVSCIVVVPAIFQLTYYGANKMILGDETLRILMVNEEKRQGGEEIGVTKLNTVESTGEFAIQLDWISVPWYKEVENIMYESTLDNVQKVKLEAYRDSPVYNNKDVTLYNDGVYVTTDDLFDSVSIDYTFNATGSERGLYLNTQDTTQTASFYSPYYVFLRSLTADVNEYNRWLNNGSNSYSNEEEATSEAAKDKSVILGSYNYTTKYMSGERLKTVGLCEAYFESNDFMEYDTDLLHLYQIYMAPDDDKKDKEAGPARVAVKTRERSYDRAMLFNDSERNQFESSYWYDSELIFTDSEYYDKVKAGDGKTKAELQEAYVEKRLEPFYKKVEAMDNYARDFIAKNKDMIGKITDETFIKTMALAMSIKYNQLFGVNAANSVEIYNMDSEDLLRLCFVPSDQAVVSTSMSYSRFVYAFGGEAGVYLAAILSVIMWLGSFIKPLCTIVVFISIFLSIFVFRVVLGKPSANIWGYIVTATLLCVTNVLHAVILKVGVSLPGFGLSTVGCLIFIIIGQVTYLLFLSYVTGVALKDWSNLGANEYDKEAKLLKSKFLKGNTTDMMSGNIKHYDNNWEYYNVLVDQHRERNRS